MVKGNFQNRWKNRQIWEQYEADGPCNNFEQGEKYVVYEWKHANNKLHKIKKFQSVVCELIIISGCLLGYI